MVLDEEDVRSMIWCRRLVDLYGLAVVKRCDGENLKTRGGESH